MWASSNSSSQSWQGPWRAEESCQVAEGHDHTLHYKHRLIETSMQLVPKHNVLCDVTRQSLLIFLIRPADTLASLLLNDTVVIVAFQNEALHGYTDTCAENIYGLFQCNMSQGKLFHSMHSLCHSTHAPPIC